MAVRTAQGWRENDWFVRNSNNQWKPCVGGWVMVRDPFISPSMNEWKPFIFGGSAEDLRWRSSPFAARYLSTGIATFKNTIVVSTNGGGVMVNSRDGDPGYWSERSLPTTAVWTPPCAGSSRVVMLAKDSSRATYSLDGLTWINAHLPVAARWHRVAWNGARYVAIADGSATGGVTTSVVYSTSGVQWTAGDLPISTRWAGIAALGSEFIVLPVNGRVSYHSNNGSTWVTRTLPDVEQWKAVGTGMNMAIAIGHGAGTTSNKYCIYKAGVWTSRRFPLAAQWGAINYVNGLWVVLADTLGSSRALVSTDGEAWTQIPGLPANGPASTIASTPTKIITVPVGENVPRDMEYLDYPA